MRVASTSLHTHQAKRTNGVVEEDCQKIALVPQLDRTAQKMFGKKGQGPKEETMETDPTGWMIDGGLAEFLLMHTNEIKYMAMLGYTYMHGR